MDAREYRLRSTRKRYSFFIVTKARPLALSHMRSTAMTTERSALHSAYGAIVSLIFTRFPSIAEKCRVALGKVALISNHPCREHEDERFEPRCSGCRILISNCLTKNLNYVRKARLRKSCEE